VRPFNWHNRPWSAAAAGLGIVTTAQIVTTASAGLVPNDGVRTTTVTATFAEDETSNALLGCGVVRSRLALQLSQIPLKLPDYDLALPLVRRHRWAATGVRPPQGTLH
jgi:hypothetical protein